MASGLTQVGNPANLPNANNYSSFGAGSALPLNLFSYQQHYAQAGHSELGAGNQTDSITLDGANPNFTNADIVSGAGSVISGDVIFNVTVSKQNLETDAVHTLQTTTMNTINAVGLSFERERVTQQSNQITSNSNTFGFDWTIYENSVIMATGGAFQGGAFSVVRTLTSFEYYYNGGLIYSSPRLVTFSISGAIGTLNNLSPQNVSGNGVTFTPNGSSGSAVVSAVYSNGDISEYYINVGSTLPNGTVGVPYLGNPTQGTGGTAPYSYNVCVGNLPTGTNMNPSDGQITGTPTVNGTYNFDVCQLDANGVLIQQTPYSIVVGGGATNPIFSTVCPQNLTVNQNASLAVDVLSNWTANVAGGSFAPSPNNQTGVTYTPPTGYTGTIIITATNVADNTKSTTCNLVYSAVVVPAPSTTIDVGNSACNVIEVAANTQDVNVQLNPANVGVCGNNTIWVKRTDCSAFNFFITTTTGDIDGLPNIQLNCREAVMLYWNGVRWIALADYTNLA